MERKEEEKKKKEEGKEEEKKSRFGTCLEHFLSLELDISSLEFVWNSCLEILV